MRPAPQCRTFNSSAVEVRPYTSRLRNHLCLMHLFIFACTINRQNVIADMKARLKDPDLARLFENTFPNTLGVLRNGLSCALHNWMIWFHRYDCQVLRSCAWMSLCRHNRRDWYVKRWCMENRIRIWRLSSQEWVWSRNILSKFTNSLLITRISRMFFEPITIELQQTYKPQRSVASRYSKPICAL